jgi:hypothetical protein
LAQILIDHPFHRILSSAEKPMAMLIRMVESGAMKFDCMDEEKE